MLLSAAQFSSCHPTFYFYWASKQSLVHTQINLSICNIPLPIAPNLLQPVHTLLRKTATWWTSRASTQLQLHPQCCLDMLSNTAARDKDHHRAALNLPLQACLPHSQLASTGPQQKLLKLLGSQRFPLISEECLHICYSRLIFLPVSAFAPPLFHYRTCL